MISCRLTTDVKDTNHLGWPRHTCGRCKRSWHMSGMPSEWRGDPVYCFSKPEWWEFGCWVAIGLAVVGITKKRYGWLTGTPGCRGCQSCEEREVALNTVGSRFARWLAALGHKAHQAVVLFAQRLMGFFQQLFSGDRDRGGGPDADADLVPRPDSQNLHDDVAVNDDP